MQPASYLHVAARGIAVAPLARTRSAPPSSSHGEAGDAVLLDETAPLGIARTHSVSNSSDATERLADELVLEPAPSPEDEALPSAARHDTPRAEHDMTKQNHSIALDGKEDPDAQVEGEEEEEEEERACDKDWENMTEEETTAATLLGWESAEVPPAPPRLTRARA